VVKWANREKTDTLEMKGQQREMLIVWTCGKPAWIRDARNAKGFNRRKEM
jgi:hypothetical protein